MFAFLNFIISLVVNYPKEIIQNKGRATGEEFRIIYYT